MGLYILPNNQNFLSLSGGTVSGGTLFSNSLSAVTYYSGSTPLEQIIANIAIQNSGSSYVFSAGTNLLLLTSATNPNITYSLSNNPSINSILATTISGGTLYSGSTDLYSIFSQVGHTHQFSAILNTAHTHSVSDVTNLSSLLDTKLNLSGGTMTGGLTTTSLSATTISGGTLYSGSTNLNSIFAPIGSNTPTSVQPGLNTYTGGTSTSPSVNISALTINSLTASGSSVLNTVSANTLSAQTIFSGSSNLSSVINTFIPTQIFATTPEFGVKQIYPVNNNFSLTYYSVILGSNNTGSSKYSTVLNGSLNKIVDTIGNLYNNTIVGGKNQTIYNAKYSVLLNGRNNYNSGYYSVGSGIYNFIGNAPELVFVFGKYNTILSNSYSFLFGQNHLVSGNSSFSSIFGGKNNKIYSSSILKYNLISNSYDSKISESQNSVIHSGSGNTIQNSSFSNIINGQNNIVINNFSSINNGKNNIVTSTFSTVLNGLSNTGRSNYSTVINGKNNYSLGKFSLIGSGVNNKNTTASTYYSIVLNGYNNQISTCHAGYGSNITSNFGSIINGRKNHVFRSYSSIVNGNFNHGSGVFSFIGNGYSNKTNFNHESTSANTVLNGILNRTKHDFATIINGFFNTIETTYGFIGNGTYNQLPSDGFFNTVLNGKRHNIQGGYFNQIINGDYNFIEGLNIRHNTILNGSRNKIPNNFSGVTILGGVGLTATTSNTAIGDFAQFRSLTGGGTQMVVANSSGLLSVQSIPSAGQSTIIRSGLNTYTAGTTNDYTINVSALTINTFTASGNSVFTGTLSGGSSFSANTLYSGSTNLSSIFQIKNGVLLQKAGLVSGSTFAGSPLTATINFSNPFSVNNYVITITGEDARMWSIQSKTISGFTINSNSSVAITGNVFWMASENGEGYK